MFCIEVSWHRGKKVSRYLGIWAHKGRDGGGACVGWTRDFRRSR